MTSAGFDHGWRVAYDRFIRKSVDRGVSAFGPRVDRVLPQWRASLTRGLSVFVFHDVTPEPSPFQRQVQNFATPRLFRRQLEWIQGRFTVIEPGRLRSLGGTGVLPINAAILSFDDSWAGTFRHGLPILREMGLPAIWFLNMATVTGDPDLAAVRAYEATGNGGVGIFRPGQVDAGRGKILIRDVCQRYGEDPAFSAYQGVTATIRDLDHAAQGGGAWFGSHLYHHWDLRSVTDDLYEESLRANANALRRYPNLLPAFATPHGYAGEDGRDLLSPAARQGIRVLFTGRGTQNEDAEGDVIDRITLPGEPATPRSWWHATHLARLIGERSV